MSDCLCIGRQHRGNHDPGGAPFALFCSQIRKELGPFVFKIAVHEDVSPHLSHPYICECCLPEVAGAERGVAPARGQAYTFPFATLRCNMIRVCTLVTTVNNRNKKEKLYKELQSQKKEFIALHIILARPLSSDFVSFHTCTTPVGLVLCLSFCHSTQSLYSWLNGDHRNS